MPELPIPGHRHADVAKFLDQLRSTQPEHPAYVSRGRLLFALDATASREATWDHACQIQGEMFEATAAIGGLDCQLVYYRGFNECKASRWLTSAAELRRVMRSVSCVGGVTQIERVLDHAIRETSRAKVGALVFIGDAIEETVDRLCRLAGKLGSLGVPIFLFHEGDNPDAAAAFRQMAIVSHGACLAFDLAGIARLKELLGAVAVYAAGGHAALAAHSNAHKSDAVLRLTAELRQ